MELGSSGAITGGAADIWHWQSVPTDNNPSDQDFPGGYTDPTGKAIYPNNNMSFAEDDFTDMTGFFVTGGSFGADAPNLDPTRIRSSYTLETPFPIPIRHGQLKW